MGRVLIVDGDGADRARTAETLAAEGHEIEEAPDGLEAFEILLEVPFDVVIMEARLDKLDAPDLITKLRAHGVATQILIFTAVTKAATLSGLKHLGISGYVHKASPPDLLRHELAKALRAAVPTADPVPPAVAAAGPTEGGASPGGNVLLVDSMQTEQARLRALLPPSVGLDCCSTVNDGLARGHGGVYRMVLFDSDASVLNLSGVVAQLHVLQPEAAIIAVALIGKERDAAAVAKSLGSLGFDDMLLKPFQPADVALFAQRYCTSWDDLVTVRDEVVEVSRFRCRREHRDRYGRELATRLEAVLRPLSEACFDQVILDVTRADHLLPTEAVVLLGNLERAARALGVTLLVAVDEGLAANLRGLDESFSQGRFRWFTSVSAARSSFC